MNQKPVRLVPLQCVKCQAPVRANVDEVAWVCEQCGQGLLLAQTTAENISTVEIEVFFSNALPQGKPGYPFWVTSGTVNIARRDTYRGNEGKAAQAFWSAPRLFYVSAWAASLDDLVANGVRRLYEPVPMQAGSRTAFLPVVTLPADLRPLCEFMVMSVEAARSDYLKHVDFDIKLLPPQLWILP
jgi:hypothetical protein